MRGVLGVEWSSSLLETWVENLREWLSSQVGRGRRGLRKEGLTRLCRVTVDVWELASMASMVGSCSPAPCHMPGSAKPACSSGLLRAP
jgi:hypothetical protein